MRFFDGEFLSVDSSGVVVKRVVDILTPDDDVLKYVNVHE